jgi:hypothetical protein
VGQKLLYIFKHLNKQNTMQTKFHLLLDRSEYTSTDIIPLQSMLKDYAHSEGAKTFQKTSIVSINDLTSSEIEEAWIEDNKYNGEDVTFIHWYNKHFYIIQTN